jgi:DNA-binding MltR family transcriptional regulator
LRENILEWVTFTSELSKESDRGCALLAASHLDFLIEDLLKVKMVGTKKQVQSLFDFNGPMGTFSSRILISFSIGLISKSYVKDLQIIRKVRNEFGHSPSIINFDNER